jgi:predicted dinucleotide-binding enzyme
MIGGTVARLAVAAGHPVVLSNSRGPQTLAGLVAELGPHGPPYGTFEDEKGHPAGEDVIRAALAAATR